MKLALLKAIATAESNRAASCGDNLTPVGELLRCFLGAVPGAVCQQLLGDTFSGIVNSDHASSAYNGEIKDGKSLGASQEARLHSAGTGNSGCLVGVRQSVVEPTEVYLLNIGIGCAMEPSVTLIDHLSDST